MNAKAQVEEAAERLALGLGAAGRDGHADVARAVGSFVAGAAGAVPEELLAELTADLRRAAHLAETSRPEAAVNMLTDPIGRGAVAAAMIAGAADAGARKESRGGDGWAS